MFGLTKYALGSAVLASLTLGGLLYAETKRAAALSAENERLTASLAAMKLQADQAREAANVANAVIERERAKSAEFDAIKETLLKGNTDAPLPDWFADLLDDLGIMRGDDPDDLRGPRCAESPAHDC